MTKTMDCSGHINKITSKFIYGWAVDETNPNNHLTVNLIIDGAVSATAKANRHRPDLINKRPKASRSGFIIAIPSKHYDDCTHTIKLETGNGVLILLDSHTRTLRAADKLALSSEVIHKSDSNIIGWAASDSPEELIVDLYIDGDLHESKPARRAVTINGNKVTCGFSFNIAKYWSFILQNRQVTIVVAGTDHLIHTISAADLAQQVYLSGHRVESNRLTGQITHPNSLTPADYVVAYLGEQPLTIDWGATSELSRHKLQTSYSVLLPKADADRRTVQFRTTSGDYLVGQIQIGTLEQNLSSQPSDREEIVVNAPHPISKQECSDGDIRKALANGGFRNWAKGLEVPLQAKRVELADNWFFSTKTLNNPGIAKLETVIVRDPAEATRGTSHFGLRLLCELETVAVLEGGLNTTAGFNPTKCELAFYLKALSAFGLGGELKRVLLLQRDYTLAQDGKPQTTTKTLAVLARNIRPTLTGATIRAVLPEAVTKTTPDNSTLHIALELTGKIDIVIADAHLQRFASAEPDTASIQKEVMLEDKNIKAQTGLIKGLWHWDYPFTIQPCTTSKYSHSSDDRFSEKKWSACYYDGETIEVVVPVFNAPDETLDCLRSIEVNTPFPHLVTVIDDGSSSETALRLEAFARHKPWIKIIRNPKNLGYTMAANRGLAQSKAKWVVLLNSDTIVTAHWLEGLLECAASDSNVAFVGAVSNAASWQSVPQLTDAAGKFKTNSIPHGLTIEDMASIVERESTREFPEVPLLNGFCTLMRRSVLDEIGFLDEEAFPVGYGEENDLCVRATNAGYKLRIADHVYVYHVKSVSFGSGRRTELVKLGAQAFKRKHPSVDLREVQAKLQECTPLITLRKNILAALAKYSTGVVEQ